MDNLPKYKIHGTERVEMKKKLSKLKYYVKDFWHDHNTEKDMSLFYGGSVMSDADAKILFDSRQKEIFNIEEELNIPHISVVREIKLNDILNNT